MTHVQKCETDLIRCSGGAGSPEHRLPRSDSGVNSPHMCDMAMVLKGEGPF